jgi:hypothetical protein
MRLLAVPILIFAVVSLPACKRSEAHTDPRVNPESQSGFYPSLTYINEMPGRIRSNMPICHLLTAFAMRQCTVIGRSLP